MANKEEISIGVRWKSDTLGFIYGFCQCLVCKNILDSQKRSCKAFDVIPSKVWNNSIKHSEIFKTQNSNYIFEVQDEQ